MSDDVFPEFSVDHAQAVAMALAYFPAHLSAGILAALPEPMQGDAAMCLAMMASAPEQVRTAGTHSVMTYAAGVTTNDYSGVDGVEVLAGLLNHVDGQAVRSILGAIGALHPVVARHVREAMFGFDDLARLDDPSIQCLLREIEPNTLVFALHGADPQIADRFLDNLSTRVREMVVDDVNSYRPGLYGRPSTDTARQQIATVARRLYEAGMIVAPTTDDQNENSA